MALSRAQLLAGDSSQGDVLLGQVQAVKAGAGISIDGNGVISVDVTSLNSVVKTNNNSAFNGYIWPNPPQGAANSFLKTDGTGILSWVTLGTQFVELNNPGANNSYMWPNSDGAANSFLQTDGSNGLSWVVLADQFIAINNPGANNSYIWPTNDGAPNTVLQTNGSNALSWVDLSTTYLALNQAGAYNLYQWPTSAPTSTKYLASNSSGVLSWETAGVIVSGTAPTSPTEGMLWFDCDSGTLNTYESCTTGTGKWTPANQSGLPVNPASTVLTPLPSSGTGTLADPYIVSATTVGAGSAAVIVTSVVITGLAADQFVPIVDMAAAANGGRFSFTNYYANGAGTLSFDVLFIDNPISTPGTTYTANIRVGNASAYIDADVNVTAALVINNPGSISGTTQVGSTLTYTQGSASGGTAPISYSWTWNLGSDGSILQNGGGTYVTTSSELLDTIYVEFTATDFNSLSDSANTAPTGIITQPPFPNPTPPTIPTTTTGTNTFTWDGSATTLTSIDCLEFQVNGAGFDQGPTAVDPGDTVDTRWISSVGCADAPNGTTILGALEDPNYSTTSSITIDRLPTTFTFVGATVVPTQVATSNIIAPTGYNSEAYVTGSLGAGGSTLEANVNNAGFVAVPASGTSLPINPGQTLQVRFTTGSSEATPYTATINIGEGASFTSAVFTATTSQYIFPGTSFTPVGAPSASPASVNISGSSLYGTASGTWADGTTSISATGNLQYKIDSGSYGQSANTVNDLQVVSLIWSPTDVASAAHGANLSGTLTNGVNINSYGMTVNRSPDSITFTDLDDQIASTLYSSNVQTASGFNVPVSLYYTPGTNPLTSVKANINNTGFVTLPTSLPGLTVNPGDTIQIQGQTGIASSTDYSVTVTLGSSTGTPVSDEWIVNTADIPPSVTTPTIDTPAANATGIALNINVTGTAYSSQGGAGPQASTDWQVYRGIPGAPKSSAITNVNVNSQNNPLSSGGWSSTSPSVSYYQVAGNTGAPGYCYINDNCWLTWASYYDPGVPEFQLYLFTKTTALTTDGGFVQSSSCIRCDCGGYLGAWGSGWAVMFTRTGGSNAMACDEYETHWTTNGGGSWTREALPKIFASSSGGVDPSIALIAYSRASTTTCLAGRYVNGQLGASVNVTNLGPTSGLGPRSPNYMTKSKCGCWFMCGWLRSDTCYGEYSSDGGFNFVPYTTAFPDYGSFPSIANVNGEIWFYNTTTNCAVITSDFTNFRRRGIAWNGAGSASKDLSTVNKNGLFFISEVSNAPQSRYNIYASFDACNWSQIFSNVQNCGGMPTAGPVSTCVQSVGATNYYFVENTLKQSVTSTTTLTFSDATNFSSFNINDAVVESGGGGDAAGTIYSKNTGSCQIVISGSSGTWDVNSLMQDNSAPLVAPGAPTAYPPGSSYASVVDLNTTTSSEFTSYPLTSLQANSVFYARVQYNSATIPTASGFSPWSKFTTA